MVEKTDSLDKIEIGKMIKEAVLETDKWIANNTNLGIVMLLTPLICCCRYESMILMNFRKRWTDIMQVNNTQ